MAIDTLRPAARGRSTGSSTLLASGEGRHATGACCAAGAGPGADVLAWWERTSAAERERVARARPDDPGAVGHRHAAAVVRHRAADGDVGARPRRARRARRRRRSTPTACATSRGSRRGRSRTRTRSPGRAAPATPLRVELDAAVGRGVDARARPTRPTASPGPAGEYCRVFVQRMPRSPTRRASSPSGAGAREALARRARVPVSRRARGSRHAAVLVRGPDARGSHPTRVRRADRDARRRRDRRGGRVGLVRRGDPRRLRAGDRARAAPTCRTTRCIHGPPGLTTDVGAGATVAHNCVVHGAILGDGVPRRERLGRARRRARSARGALVAAGSVVAAGTTIPAGHARGRLARGREAAGEGQRRRVLGRAEPRRVRRARRSATAPASATSTLDVATSPTATSNARRRSARSDAAPPSTTSGLAGHPRRRVGARGTARPTRCRRARRGGRAGACAPSPPRSAPTAPGPCRSSRAPGAIALTRTPGRELLRELAGQVRSSAAFDTLYAPIERARAGGRRPTRRSGSRRRGRASSACHAACANRSGAAEVRVDHTFVDRAQVGVDQRAELRVRSRRCSRRCRSPPSVVDAVLHGGLDHRRDRRPSPRPSSTRAPSAASAAAVSASSAGLRAYDAHARRPRPRAPRRSRGRCPGSPPVTSADLARRPAAPSPDRSQVEPRAALGAGRRDRVHVALAQDQVLLAPDLDLEAGVGREQHPVAGLDVAHRRARPRRPRPTRAGGRRRRWPGSGSRRATCARPARRPARRGAGRRSCGSTASRRGRRRPSRARLAAAARSGPGAPVALGSLAAVLGPGWRVRAMHVR